MFDPARQDRWLPLDGALKEGGMAAFAQVLDHAQAGAIRDFIVHRAREDEAALGTRKRQPDPNHGAMIVAQGTAVGGNASAQCHAFTGILTAAAPFRVSRASPPLTS